MRSESKKTIYNSNSSPRSQVKAKGKQKVKSKQPKTHLAAREKRKSVTPKRAPSKSPLRKEERKQLDKQHEVQESEIKSSMQNPDLDEVAKVIKKNHPILSKFQIETIKFLMNQRKGVIGLKKGEALFKSDDE